jgi:hypothetical protein
MLSAALPTHVQKAVLLVFPIVLMLLRLHLAPIVVLNNPLLQAKYSSPSTTTTLLIDSYMIIQRRGWRLWLSQRARGAAQS